MNEDRKGFRKGFQTCFNYHLPMHQFSFLKIDIEKNDLKTGIEGGALNYINGILNRHLKGTFTGVQQKGPKGI